jgi:hypothetical protein
MSGGTPFANVLFSLRVAEPSLTGSAASGLHTV